MKNPFRGLRFSLMDFRAARSSVGLKIAMFGIALIPLIYGAMYLMAFYDPYGNLDTMPVAVVNEDVPAKTSYGSLVSAGDDLVEELKESKSLDYHFLDNDEAQAGLENGTYYNKIVIPADFSAKIVSADTENPQKAQLTLVTNDANNYLSSILGASVMRVVTAKTNYAVGNNYYVQIFDKIEDTGESIKVAADGATELSDGLVDAHDGSQTITTNLQTAEDGSRELGDGLAAAYDGSSTITTKLGDAADGATKLAEGTEDAADGSEKITSGLEDASDGADSLDEGLGELRDGLKEGVKGSKELADGVSQLHDGSQSLTDGLSSAKTGSASLESGLGELSTGSSALATGIGSAYDGASSLKEGLDSAKTGSKQVSDGAAQLVTGMETAAGQLDPLVTGATNLKGGLDTLDTSLGTLKGGADQAITGVDGLIALVKGGGAVTAEQLEGLKAGLQQVSGGLEQAQSSVQKTLAPGAQQIAGGVGTAKAALVEGGQLHDGAAALASGASSLDTGLGQLVDGSGSLVDGLASAKSGADSVSSGLSSAQSGASSLASGISSAYDGSSTITTNLQTASEGADSLVTGTKALSKGAKSAKKGAHSLSKGLSKLYDGSSTLTDGLTTAKDGSATLADGLGQLQEGSSTLTDGLATAKDGSARLTDGLDQLHEGSSTLTEGLATAQDGSEELADGLSDGVEKVEESTRGTDAKADMMSEPIELEQETYTEVSNYGTGFAPYFIALGLWVGALVMTFLFKPLNGRLIASGASPAVAAFSGLVPWILLGIVQALLLGATIQFGCGIEVLHPEAYYPLVILSSIVFCAIIQAVIAVFGFPSKFIAVVLLMLQLTTAAGTFPIETEFQIFQTLSPFLPMTYIVHALRIAMRGIDLALIGKDVLILLAFAAIAFVITCLTARRKRLITMMDLHPLVDL